VGFLEVVRLLPWVSVFHTVSTSIFLSGSFTEGPGGYDGQLNSEFVSEANDGDTS
jgi:hypothetical protein